MLFRSIQSPKGWKADGADMVLLQVEVMDKDGRRCPLANDLIHFEDVYKRQG